MGDVDSTDSTTPPTLDLDKVRDWQQRAAAYFNGEIGTEWRRAAYLLAVNGVPWLLAALASVTAERDEARQFEARVWQRIQTWNDDPQTRLEAFAITHEHVAEARAEADRLSRKLAETQAERNYLRRVLDAANATTGAAQKIVEAAVASGEATIGAAPVNTADEPDWVTVLDDAMAASGVKLVFDPRNWTAPHTVRGPKATDPDREHPAHVGKTCDEYEAAAPGADEQTAPLREGPMPPGGWPCSNCGTNDMDCIDEMNRSSARQRCCGACGLHDTHGDTGAAPVAGTADGVTPSGIAYRRQVAASGLPDVAWELHPDCPKCGRPTGHACRSSFGHDQAVPHPERRLAAPVAGTTDEPNIGTETPR